MRIRMWIGAVGTALIFAFVGCHHHGHPHHRHGHGHHAPGHGHGHPGKGHHKGHHKGKGHDHHDEARAH